MGWKRLRSLPAGNETPVLAWHAYSGTMVDLPERIRRNRFYTHWMAIDDGAWTLSAKRKPTEADADAYSCVVARNQWGDVSMAGWHRFSQEPGLTHWQPPPPPPPHFRALREKFGDKPRQGGI